MQQNRIDSMVKVQCESFGDSVFRQVEYRSCLPYCKTKAFVERRGFRPNFSINYRLFQAWGKKVAHATFLPQA